MSNPSSTYLDILYHEIQRTNVIRQLGAGNWRFKPITRISLTPSVLPYCPLTPVVVTLYPLYIVHFYTCAYFLNCYISYQVSTVYFVTTTTTQRRIGQLHQLHTIEGSLYYRSDLPYVQTTFLGSLRLSPVEESNLPNMLSSSPAVPLHSIDFHDDDRRRLSLRTHGGQEYLTAHDGLPSPEHLTPISGTPRAMTPETLSRRGSDLGEEMDREREKERDKLRSGTLAFDEHAGFGTMSHLNRAPSRRTAVANKEDQVSLSLLCVLRHYFHTLYLTPTPVFTGQHHPPLDVVVTNLSFVRSRGISFSYLPYSIHIYGI